MDDLPATIAAFTALIVAVGAFVLNFLKDRHAERAARAAEHAATAAELAAASAELSNAKLVEIDGKIFNLGKAVDGKLTKLLDLTREAALAKGRLEGAAIEKADAADKADEATAARRRNGDPHG